MILLGIIQSLVGFFVFLLRKPKHSSNYILAFWLITIAGILSGGLVEGGVVQYFKPGVFPLVFLFGPLLFLYIQAQVSSNFSFNFKQLLHLIPFVLVVFHRVFSQAKNMDFIETGEQNLINTIYQFLMLISIVIYWIAGISTLLRYQLKLKDNFSYRSERLTLNWTWLIVFINILIFVVSFLSPFLDTIISELEPDLIFHFNFALFAFLLLLFGVLQPVIFKAENKLVKTQNLNEKEGKKYSRSGLTSSEINELVQQIIVYFEKQKPFLNPEFDLQKMAVDLDVPRQNLSQAINESLNKNFYRLVNEYRVEEVKLKIADSRFSHLNILGIALESGFNSKASFNRVFKEITQQTPSEYKNKI